MKMKGQRERWQKRELARILEAQRGTLLEDRLQLTLRNPEEAPVLDAMLTGFVWDEMQGAVARSGLEWWTGSRETLEENLSSGDGRYTTRELHATLRDPDRPGGPHGPHAPWWGAMGVKVTGHSYHVDARSTLSFPTGSIKLALGIAKEPLMQGCPPDVSWNEPWGDGKEGTWNVAVETGHGHDLIPMALIAEEADRGGQPRDVDPAIERAIAWNTTLKEEATTRVRDTADGLLRIAHAMDALAQAWADPERAKALHHAVLRLHVAY